MSEQHPNFDEVLATALQLTPSEKVRLITQLATMLEREVSALSANVTPRTSLYGILKGSSISAEDIDEARREMWANFPRDDIAPEPENERLHQLHGLLADLGDDPTAEDIDEVRAEMLRNFPREDVF